MTVAVARGERVERAAIRLALDPTRLYCFSPETGESLLSGHAALAAH